MTEDYYNVAQSRIFQKALAQARDDLRNLLSLCDSKQQDIFNRMYKEGIENIPVSKLDWACKQVENTLAKRADFEECMQTIEAK